MQAGSSSELSVILSLAHAVDGDVQYIAATISGETLQSQVSFYAQIHLFKLFQSRLMFSEAKSGISG